MHRGDLAVQAVVLHDLFAGVDEGSDAGVLESVKVEISRRRDRSHQAEQVDDVT